MSLCDNNRVVPLSNILFFFSLLGHEKRVRSVHFKGYSVSLAGVRGAKGYAPQVYTATAPHRGVLLGQTRKI